MEEWHRDRLEIVTKEKRKYHDILWDEGETMTWFKQLYEMAGLPSLEGAGRCPPVLGEETRWAIDHIKKYPVPGDGKKENKQEEENDDVGWVEGEWVVVDSERDEVPIRKKDSLFFI